MSELSYTLYLLHEHGLPIKIFLSQLYEATNQNVLKPHEQDCRFKMV
jgi:hypothetical protein